jgi:hypothetical protein
MSAQECVKAAAQECIRAAGVWLGQHSDDHASLIASKAQRLKKIDPMWRDKQYQDFKAAMDEFARGFFWCLRTLTPTYEDVDAYRRLTPKQIGALPEWERAYRLVYMRFGDLYAALVGVRDALRSAERDVCGMLRMA